MYILGGDFADIIIIVLIDPSVGLGRGCLSKGGFRLLETCLDIIRSQVWSEIVEG
jgi:hypothetical protein